MKKYNIQILIGLMFVFTACEVTLEGTTQNASCFSIADCPARELSARERWPDELSQSFYVYEYDMGSCVAAGQFNTKADYCTYISDREFNNNCAASMRSLAYTFDCGPDWEETNITEVFYRSGYDSALDRSCSTHLPTRPFSYKGDYCEFLKDESKHNLCHWQGRKDTYDLESCASLLLAKDKSSSFSEGP
ncbi:MAG: hypothetical protein AB8E15_02135 [Bdellovibrionales bacterium]